MITVLNQFNKQISINLLTTNESAHNGAMDSSSVVFLKK